MSLVFLVCEDFNITSGGTNKPPDCTGNYQLLTEAELFQLQNGLPPEDFDSLFGFAVLLLVIAFGTKIMLRLMMDKIRNS